jgi:hypothetical protein
MNSASTVARRRCLLPLRPGLRPSRSWEFGGRRLRGVARLVAAVLAPPTDEASVQIRSRFSRARRAARSYPASGAKSMRGMRSILKICSAPMERDKLPGFDSLHPLQYLADFSSTVLHPVLQLLIIFLCGAANRQRRAARGIRKCEMGSRPRPNLDHERAGRDILVKRHPEGD